MRGTRSAPWRGAGAVGVAVLVLVCVLPIAVLVPSVIAEPGTALSALSPRRLGLLLTSARLATLVLVADTLVAGAVALWAHAAGRRRATAVLSVALAAAFVPPVAHAAAWAGAGDVLRRTLSLAVTPVAGLGAAALAQSTAYLPFAIAIALAGVHSVDPALLDAARAQRPDPDALRRVLLPLALPAILAGGAVSAILSLGDEAVPAAFGVDTSAMELFASFAADGRAGSTLALGWPLAVLAALASLACVAPLMRSSMRPSWGRAAWSTPPSFDGATSAALGAGAFVAAGASVMVLGALVVGSWPPAVATRAIASASSEIWTTVAVCAACALVAAVVGLAAGAPRGPRSQAPRWVWAVALVAMVVPAPVAGAGLVALTNTAWTGMLYDSPLMIVLASLARFAPLAAVIVAVAGSRLHAATLEASLVSRSPGGAYVRVVAPLLAPAAVAGGLLVAAFAAGELGATLMVLPAGQSTAVVRAFNLLHYGASQEVAAIALAVASLGAGAAAGAYAIGRRAWLR